MQITSTSETIHDSLCRPVNNWSYDQSVNGEYITFNFISSDLLPYVNSGDFKFSGEFQVSLNGGWYSGAWAGMDGFVVVPYIDNLTCSADVFNSYLGEMNLLHFSFNMLFNDPTLQTAETHEYKIEFWDGEWGQCKLDEYDKKTVKRGEAIITVNYTP